VNVQWRTEPGWFPLGLEHGERAGRCGSVGKHDCFKVPEVQQTALPLLHDEGLGHAGQDRGR
jgi:hypothetical protein